MKKAIYLAITVFIVATSALYVYKMLEKIDRADVIETVSASSSGLDVSSIEGLQPQSRQWVVKGRIYWIQLRHENAVPEYDQIDRVIEKFEMDGMRVVSVTVTGYKQLNNPAANVVADTALIFLE